jgi:hypothetical protein
MKFEEFRSAVIGEWQGSKQLYLAPPPEPALSSRSQLSVRSIAEGSFLQFDYDWIYKDEAQSGALLFGYEEEKAASAAWVDSFHMSSKIMLCTGSTTDGSAELHGSYEAPPGPDWGWRITIRSISMTELQIVMHNIWPEGQEDLAVRIDYRRNS